MILTNIENIAFVAKDVIIKIGLDTIFSKDIKKKIKFNWPEIVQTAAISGVYVMFIKNTLTIRMKSNMPFRLLAGFLAEVFGKSITHIITMLIWNTLIDLIQKKDGKEMILKKGEIKYVRILLSSIMSSIGSVIYDVIKGGIMQAPSSKSINKVIQG